MSAASGFCRGFCRGFGGLLIGIGLLSGLMLWVFYLLAPVDWLGAGGFIVAVIAAPGVVVFPIVFWAVEGTLPLTYFAYLLVGVLLPPLGFSMMRD